MTGAPDTASEEGAPEESAPERSVGEQAAVGFLWANAGVVVRYGLSMVLVTAIARILDPVRYPDEFRGLTVIMLVTVYLDTVLNVGVGAAIVYEQERGITRRVRVAFTANVGLACLLALVAYFGAPFLTSLFKLPGDEAAFRGLAVVVLLSGLLQVPWALFMRDLRFKARAMVEVCRDVTRFGVTVAIAVAYHRGAWAGVIGLISSYSVALVLTWSVLRFVPRFAWDRATARELVRYAGKMAANRFLGLLALNGDYLIVGPRLPNQFPYYHQAFRVPEVVLAGQLTAVSDVLLPSYSRVRGQGREALAAAMLRALRLLGILAFPLSFLMALGARDTITVLFTERFLPSVSVMELISIAGLFASLGFATGDLFFAMDKGRVMVILNGIMVPVMLTTMWFMVPYGITAIAWVHVVNAGVFLVVRQVVANRMMGTTFPQVFDALRPGFILGVGVVAGGLPVRLMTDSGGLLPGLAVLAGAIVGGGAAALLRREALNEVLGLLHRIRGG